PAKDPSATTATTFVRLFACAALSAPPSFPTRRSSDLYRRVLFRGRSKRQRDDRAGAGFPRAPHSHAWTHFAFPPVAEAVPAPVLDRKSTRLNSSHEWISYAVFCLEKTATWTAWLVCVR